MSPHQSDHGQLTWHEFERYVTLETSRSLAVIGDVKGETFTFKNGTVQPNGEWAAIQLTVVDGDDFKTATRILITATGRAANTDMKWTSDAHESVGRNWGRAPSLVEGIAAKITLPISGQKMKAWALDERGQRRDEIPLTNGTLEIGPQYRTLWYEIAAE